MKAAEKLQIFAAKRLISRHVVKDKAFSVEILACI